jgi:hypothetical protein
VSQSPGRFSASRETFCTLSPVTGYEIVGDQTLGEQVVEEPYTVGINHALGEPGRRHGEGYEGRRTAGK